MSGRDEEPIRKYVYCDCESERSEKYWVCRGNGEILLGWINSKEYIEQMNRPTKFRFDKVNIISNKREINLSDFLNTITRIYCFKCHIRLNLFGSAGDTLKKYVTFHWDERTFG